MATPAPKANWASRFGRCGAGVGDHVVGVEDERDTGHDGQRAGDGGVEQRCRGRWPGAAKKLSQPAISHIRPVSLALSMVPAATMIAGEDPAADVVEVSR